MTNGGKTQVFISWSGTYAKQVARALHTWVDAVFDNAQPWMSDIDIAGGQRGMEEIDKSLDGSRFGIIVVTSENHSAPWINYEAGALGRTVEDGKLRVMPILVDVRLQDISGGPIGQLFQSAPLDRDGIGRLAHSLGEVLGLSPNSVDAKLKVWTEPLFEDLGQITVPTAPPAPRKPEADVLDEILAGIITLRSDVNRLSAAPRPDVYEPFWSPSGGTAVTGARQTGMRMAQSERKTFVRRVAALVTDLAVQYGVSPVPGATVSSSGTVTIQFPGHVTDDVAVDFALKVEKALGEADVRFTRGDDGTVQDPGAVAKWREAIPLSEQ